MDTPTEDDYQSLLVFIQGQHSCTGIHTYPNGSDNQRNMHAGCLELERRGLIYRVEDQPDHIYWKATL